MAGHLASVLLLLFLIMTYFCGEGVDGENILARTHEHSSQSSYHPLVWILNLRRNYYLNEQVEFIIN